jgi:hypothetical protein
MVAVHGGHMFLFKSLNPVGKSVNVPGLDDLIAKMAEVWKDLKAKGSVNSAMAVQFLNRCVDTMVVYLVEHEIPGEDKKATVLESISKLYDIVMIGMLPMYLKPFAKAIKGFVMSILISNGIDWIVEKYNNGNWHPQATTEVLSLWGVPEDHRPS